MPQPLSPADPERLREAQRLAEGSAPPGHTLYGIWRRPAALEGGPEMLLYVYAPTWWVEQEKAEREAAR